MTLFFGLPFYTQILGTASAGFAFQRPMRPNTSRLQGAKPNNQQMPNIYLPDDVEVLMNGRQKVNGVSESRTPKGAKIYLPDENIESEQRHPQTMTENTKHIYAGIPDEDLLIQKSDEFEAFTWMNSNTHVQVVDHTTAGKRTTSSGKPVVLKHLFRYFTDICVDCWLSTVDPIDFLLSCNYTKSDIADMEQAFPRLTSLDVKAHLSPHIRFIVRTLGAGVGDICDGQECDIDGEGFIPHNLQVSDLGKKAVPPVFFGRRLEKTIAPGHAYLVHYGVFPHGKQLLETGRFGEFMDACDNPSKFAHLSNQWSLSVKSVGPFAPLMVHTAETVEAFGRAFHLGLLAPAQNKYTSDLDLLGCSPGKMVDLLLQHGANAIEHDRFGNSILHWAAGSGNLIAAQALISYLVAAGEGQDASEVLINTKGAKDGATPIHWASCGIKTGGGHSNICQFFLDQADDRAPELLDIECYSGSTPLMWAAWAGSLDVVKLLVSRGADLRKKNRNDASVAHWAAAGGNLDMCRYLYDEFGVRFDEKDKEGNNPLHHAVSSSHHDVSEWLITLLSDEAEASHVSPNLDLNETVPTLQ